MNKIKIIDKIFGRGEFDKAFEVYKSKSQIQMREYYSVVSKVLVEYAKNYDSLNVSYEITQRIKFYESKIFDLIQDHLDISAQIILKNCNAIKKEDEKILRNHLIELINSTNKNFIRKIEEFLNSVGHTQMILLIKPRFTNIKIKANEKIAKEFEAKIKEHNLSVTSQNKKENKSRLKNLLYDAFKIIIGIIIGYFLQSIL